MTLAPIALTCGEPAGIGPEITVKARLALGTGVPFFWIGDPRHLPDGSAWTEITTADDAHGVAPDRLPVLRHDFPSPAVPGTPVPENAAPVIAVIARAVNLVTTGKASALCTAPIHKKALKDGAGFAFPGHTEYLAHLAGVERVVMMLACDALRVVPATIHIPLSDVPGALTPALLEETIRITHSGLMRDFGCARPRLAVAGLKPACRRRRHDGPGRNRDHHPRARPSARRRTGPCRSPARRNDVSCRSARAL